jgi:ribosomal protein S18 acetylase RimI-like enzyme
MHVRSILERDLAWAAYALADLQPGFVEQCVWFVHDDGDASGLVMLYSGLAPSILFTLGPVDAVAAALAQAANVGQLPDAVYVSIRPEHEDAVGRWYDLSPTWDDRRPMVRMVLADAVLAQAAASQGELQVEPLAASDATRLAELFAHGGDFAPDAFDAGQIGNGLFYGIEDGSGALLAAGGTHVVDWRGGVGAIGNFCTLPTARGNGYAGALLSAIVRGLCAGGVQTIVLNVDQRNATAQRLYARHGFVAHCAFTEGTAKLKIDH